MMSFIKRIYAISIIGVFGFLCVSILWILIYNRATQPQTAYNLIVAPSDYTHRVTHFKVKQMLLHNVKKVDIIFYTDLEELSLYLLTDDRIKSAFLFRQFGAFFKLTKKLSPGIYLIPPGLSSFETAKYLSQASPSEQVLMVFPGETLIDIITKYQSVVQGDNQDQKIIFDSAYFKRSIELLETLYGVELDSPEGFIYPGIYFVDKAKTLDDFGVEGIKRFQEEFAAYIMPSTTSSGEDSILDIVTCASLKQLGKNQGQTNRPISTPSLKSLSSCL